MDVIVGTRDGCLANSNVLLGISSFFFFSASDVYFRLLLAETGAAGVLYCRSHKSTGLHVLGASPLIRLA